MMESKIPELNMLKDLDCIKKMGSTYLDSWEKLVTRYGERLNKGPLIKQVAFTHHDFSHHCKNIYVIIDKVLLRNVELIQEEYFVLAVAVLLHDVSMTFENFQRLCHSEQSAKYIQAEVDAGVDEWNTVQPQHVPIIIEIVRAHSDIKEEDESGHERIVNYTLPSTSMSRDGAYGKKIHVRWLAGVLRLADELDVTNARLGTAETRYMNLSLSDEEQSKSRQCWEKLNYFSNVSREKTNIVLELNESYLKIHINDDRTNIAAEIRAVRQTICKKLDEVNKEAFDNDDEYLTYIKINNVCFNDNGEIFYPWELDDDLGKENSINEQDEPAIALSAMMLSHDIIEQTPESVGESKFEHINNAVEQEKKRNEKNDQVAEGVDAVEPMQLRAVLGEKILNFIYDKELIHYGHYRLNRLFCGKDWIDVRRILSDPSIGQECIKTIATDLEMIMDRKGIEDVIAIGVSMNGNIMASRVAFCLGLPFTYVVPKKPGMIGTEMEKSVQEVNASKAVLFTGVISSMDTIKSVIKDYLEGVEIFRIYTILLRELPEISIVEKPKEIASKIVYFNKDFPCEVVPTSQCMNAIYGKCIARNRQAYSEVFEWPLAVKDSEGNRIFINNIIGCDIGCKYCYLNEIGIQQKVKYTFEEVRAEFERLQKTSPKDNIISIGCYAECMLDENLQCMKQIIQYFAEKGYFIQISTKKKINKHWLEEIENVLQFEQQLNIYTSIPTITHAKEIEPDADLIEDRIQNFEYQSPNHKVKMYLYIKPYLNEITNQDKSLYINLIKKYKLDVIVGAKFQADYQEDQYVKVGINDMYEMVSEQRESFINELKEKTQVFKHSTEPIRLNMKR